MNRVIDLSISFLQSPADQCKKIHAGDEVIQVNHQTVVCIIVCNVMLPYVCVCVCVDVLPLHRRA